MLRLPARVLVALVVSAAIVGGPTVVLSSADTPPPPGLTASLTLRSHSVEAGGTIRGMITVRNETGAPASASGCVDWFQVALVGNGVKPELRWLACAGTIELPAGTTRYPVVVHASYSHCNQLPPDPPACIGDQPPPLPPGQYKARVFEIFKAMAEPRPVTVKVAPPRHE